MLFAIGSLLAVFSALLFWRIPVHASIAREEAIGDTVTTHFWTRGYFGARISPLNEIVEVKAGSDVQFVRLRQCRFISADFGSLVLNFAFQRPGTRDVTISAKLAGIESMQRTSFEAIAELCARNRDSWEIAIPNCHWQQLLQGGSVPNVVIRQRFVSDGGTKMLSGSSHIATVIGRGLPIDTVALDSLRPFLERACPGEHWHS